MLIDTLVCKYMVHFDLIKSWKKKSKILYILIYNNIENTSVLIIFKKQNNMDIFYSHKYKYEGFHNDTFCNLEVLLISFRIFIVYIVHNWGTFHTIHLFDVSFYLFTIYLKRLYKTSNLTIKNSYVWIIVSNFMKLTDK